MKRLIIAATVLVIPLFAASQAAAQLPDASGSTQAGTVTGTGQSAIEKTPTALRMHVVLMSKAPSLKDALALMKQRREAAQKQLDGMGVVKGSVKLGSVRISTAQQGQQQQIEMMMRQRIGRGGKKEKQEIKLPVSVESECTAEWSLDGKSEEDLLIFSNDLSEKIKAADLAGLKQTQKLSPEEQELMEESQGAEMQSYYNDSGEKPGEPLFVYVTAISEADREKAMTEAYSKARDEATRLAKAAGVNLGKLHGVQNLGSGAGMAYGDYSDYEGMDASRLYRVRQSMKNRHADALEAIGTAPDKVSQKFYLSASFEIAP